MLLRSDAMLLRSVCFLSPNNLPRHHHHTVLHEVRVLLSLPTARPASSLAVGSSLLSAYITKPLIPRIRVPRLLTHLETSFMRGYHFDTTVRYGTEFE